MKKCQRCSEAKALVEFVKRSSSKDGRAGTCKLCFNKRIQDRRKGLLDDELKDGRLTKALRKELLVEGKSVCSKCANEYIIRTDTDSRGRLTLCPLCETVNSKDTYQRNKEVNLANKAKYYIDNKELLNKKSRLDYEENAERYKAKQKINGPIWDKNNRAKRRAICAAYMCRKSKATPPWLTKEMYKEIEKFYAEAVRLTEETGIMHHVDHVMPLKGKTSCGLHVPWNLQVLTRSENCSKSNKIL